MSKKYLDENGLLYFWGKLKEKLSEKVQSVKIGENGEELKKGTSVILPEYPTVPTKVSELANDNNYQTADNVSTAINNAIRNITSIEFIKLSESEYNTETGVPTGTGAAGKIYLTKNGGSAPNQYDEYIWVSDEKNGGVFEKIGTTDVDLSGYVLSSDLVAITNAEIEKVINPPEVSV